MSKYKIKIETPLGVYFTEDFNPTEEELKVFEKTINDIASGQHIWFSFHLSSGQKIVLGKDVLVNSVYSIVPVGGDKV